MRPLAAALAYTCSTLTLNPTRLEAPVALQQLEKASSHKSAKTRTGTVSLCLVILTFDLLTPKINRFPELMM